VTSRRSNGRRIRSSDVELDRRAADPGGGGGEAVQQLADLGGGMERAADSDAGVELAGGGGDGASVKASAQTTAGARRTEATSKHRRERWECPVASTAMRCRLSFFLNFPFFPRFFPFSVSFHVFFLRGRGRYSPSLYDATMLSSLKEWLCAHLLDGC